MDNDRKKNAAEWYYSVVYSSERIIPREPRPAEKLPPLLRTARSLENGTGRQWQSRESLFLKQAKLLASYEDDYPFTGNVVRYYPTYEALTDQELRGYFSWRTALRKGDVRKTSLSFVFLYIYELINQIGVADPEDGYRKLTELKSSYGQLDGSILPYLDRWLVHYAVYYGLDSGLLRELPQVVYDRSISVLEDIKSHDTAQVMEVVKVLAPKWLGRSKFYGTHQEDMGTVITRVLGRVHAHYAGCKRGFAEQYFGSLVRFEVRLFDTAVFCDPLKRRNYEYALDDRCIYQCRTGHWTVTKHAVPPKPNPKLEELTKTVDALMREAADYGKPVKCPLETKWLLKVIREEIAALLEEKKAAEKKKLHLDYSQLDKIRRDAAITREKLIVEEEEEEEALPPAAPEPPERAVAVPEAQEQEELATDLPLERAEYRLLHCLLYGEDLGWIRAEGHILSVLLDSVNDKLYDVFLDTVLEDGPQVVEDYIDELKEMVKP